MANPGSATDIRDTFLLKYLHIWLFVRVTLMIAFGHLSKILGVIGPTDDHFAKNECSFSGGDTQTLSTSYLIFLNFMRSQALGTQKVPTLAPGQ